MTVDVRPYDPQWPELAERECAWLTAALGLTPIAHIGSTAIPGLAAKPVIDMMTPVDDLSTVPDLSQLGYHLGDTGMPGRLFLRREATPASYHLHIVTTPSWATRNERILRDHLRSNPEDRDAYATLKLSLAEAGHDGDTYTRAKTALIQRMVDDARTARGLPLTSVWEE